MRRSTRTIREAEVPERYADMEPQDEYPDKSGCDPLSDTPESLVLSVGLLRKRLAGIVRRAYALDERVTGPSLANENKAVASGERPTIRALLQECNALAELTSNVLDAVLNEVGN